MATEMEGRSSATVTDASDRSRWEVTQPWLTLAARLGLAAALGYAGLSKIAAPALSVQAVAAYQLFPDSVNAFLGYTLPFFEIALALLLIVGLATRYVGGVSGLVMVGFILGITSAWARGLSIDCGCFGSGGAVAPGEADYVTPLLRDLGFVVLAGIVMIWPRSPYALDRLLGLYPPREGRS